MRLMHKVAEQWEMEKIEDPAEIYAWLRRHDGQEAVAIQDKPKVYYCGAEALRADYAGQGKTAATFYDLAKKLKIPDPPPQASSPYFCNKGRPGVCSGKMDDAGCEKCA